MQNDYTLESFHHFDGVNHADYTPNIGDVVNVLTEMVGIDKDGHPYTLAASGWLSKNVVQIEGNSNDVITLNDGTASSPIKIVHAPANAFEPANFINAYAFKPYTVSRAVISNVAQGVESAATTTSNLIKGIGQNLSWIIIVAVIIGALILFVNLKKAL